MPKKPLGILVFIVVSLGCLLIAHDYGLSFDEPIRWNGGERKLDYYAHLLGVKDNPAAMQVRADHYPGFFDLNLAWIRSISPASDWATSRVFNLFFGLAGIVATMLLANHIRKGAGLWAGGFLLLYPGWFGHMFINPKDIPFAAMYTFSLAALSYFIRADNARFFSRPLIIFAVIAGLTAATRVPGIIFFAYLALAMILGLLIRPRPEENATLQQKVFPWLREMARGCLAIVIGFTALLPWWPYLHGNPLRRTTEALGGVAHFKWEFPVFFFGEYLPAQSLPLTYLPVWFLFTTPVALMVVGAVALYTTVQTLRATKSRPAIWLQRHLSALLTVIAIAFPLVFVVALNSTLYNGLRHVLFVVPAIVALVAAGWSKWWDHGWPAAKPLHAKIALGAMVILFVPVITAMVRLHPYQYAYFNELAGGVGNAANQFESEYWGTSYREGAALLVDRLDAEGASGTILVNMEHPTWLIRPFLPDDRPYQIHLVRSQGEPADFFIANTVWHTHLWWAGEVIAIVERKGAVFCVVKDRRHLVGEQRGMFYGVPEGTLP